MPEDRPPPPETLVGALQDRVHVESEVCRPGASAKAVRDSLLDEVARWVFAEHRRTGKWPTARELRAEAERLGMPRG